MARVVNLARRLASRGLVVDAVLLSVMLTIGTALAVGAVLVHAINGEVERAADRRLADASDQLGRQLEDERQTLTVLGEALASRPQLIADLDAGRYDSVRDILRLVVRPPVDHVLIVSASGEVLSGIGANGATTSAGSIARSAAFQQALAGQPATSLARADEGFPQQEVYVPVAVNGRPKWLLRLDDFIDDAELSRFRLQTGEDVSIFLGSERVATTLRGRDGQPLRSVGANAARLSVLEGATEAYSWRDLPNGKVRTRYAPLKAGAGSSLAILAVSLSSSAIAGRLWQVLLSAAPVVLLIVIAGGGLAYLLTSGLARPLLVIAFAARRMRDGDLTTPVPPVTEPVLASLRDELEWARQNIGHAQSAMADSEQRYRDLVENTPHIVCIHDLDGRLLYSNPATHRLLGLDRLRMAALNLREVLAPESRQGFDGYLQALRETGATQGLGRVVTAAGERRTWSFNSSVRVDPAAGGPLVRMIAQDVTERFQSLALRKAIFAEVREPLLATSAEGRVVLHNTAAAELFGQDLDSQPLIKALLPLMEDNPPSAINDHLLWHGALAGSGGRQIEVEVSRTVFKQSLPIRAVYVVHDISRHVEAGRERERLLHNVAHELRGPMAVLGNALSLVAESYGDMAAGELDRMLGSATRMAQRLHLLLEDMLSAGSIQAGRFGVAPQPMGLRELIDTALDNLELRLDVTGQRIECHLPDVEAVVLADPIYAVRALSNLLSNACKYSPQGSAIGILAELAGGEARISVVDRGPGIPPDQQAGIFDRYYRAQPNERQPGIGLGLAIVKVIVEAHGGTIGFNSSPGAGSTFWFTLPLQEAALRAEPAAPVGA